MATKRVPAVVDVVEEEDDGDIEDLLENEAVYEYAQSFESTRLYTNFWGGRLSVLEDVVKGTSADVSVLDELFDEVVDPKGKYDKDEWIQQLETAVVRMDLDRAWWMSVLVRFSIDECYDLKFGPWEQLRKDLKADHPDRVWPSAARYPFILAAFISYYTGQDSIVEPFFTMFTPKVTQYNQARGTLEGFWNTVFVLGQQPDMPEGIRSWYKDFVVNTKAMFIAVMGTSDEAMEDGAKAIVNR